MRRPYQSGMQASIPKKPRGLTWSNLDRPGISRRKAGKSFSYVRPGGGVVRDAATQMRIRSLVIPPAWTDVWIAPSESGHIQAYGKDQRGRRQYKYHPKFREAREASKFDHVLEFAQALPRLRARIARQMRRPGLGRDKVLATVVHLLEATLIRVGNASYAKENKSYGLTTLLDRHVEVKGGELRFHFTGKSGKTWNLRMQDKRIARIVKSCQEIPGQHLFQYLDDYGQRREITSADVNAWLREATGRDVTAKDFRTWTGTVLAAMALREFEKANSETAAKRNVREAIEHVAGRLGNTPTICRKCYVHPEIVSAYLDGELLLRVRRQIDGALKGEALSGEEAAVYAFLRNRISRDLKKAA